MGIPTANLKVFEERVVPGAGVYACLATSQGKTYQAVTNIGVRPTFEQGQVAPRWKPIYWTLMGIFMVRVWI